MQRHEDGFSLASVMVTFVLLMAVGLGMLSLLMNSTQGAAFFEQAMQALHAAEAGLNFAIAQLVERASDVSPTDDSYAGETEDVALSEDSSSARGTFRVTVFCLHPTGALPPDCSDDPGTQVDERDFRRVVSSGVVPGRTAPARRQLEATVRRYTLEPGNTDLFGICGRDGVELSEGTSVIGDVGSNGEVLISGPSRPPGTVSARVPQPPLVAPVVEAAPVARNRGLSGTYTWRVTFVDRAGRESGGSPPTVATFLTDQLARLTSVPVGAEEVVRRRIYRTVTDSPLGPWYRVGEILDNKTTNYTDSQPDSKLIRLPTSITGRVTTAGTVSCSINCDAQVDGRVRSEVREVVCPNYLTPPARPGNDAAEDRIVQSATEQTLHLRSLIVETDGEFGIQTLSTPGAELHIHVQDIHLERGATLAVSGTGVVYFHVSGSFVLDEDAIFGAVDFSGNLITPADRIHVMITARDPAVADGGTSSVRLRGNNKVASVIFAPNANIDIDRATAFRGALFGKHIRITNSTGLILEPNEGLGSQVSAIRPTPYQYVVRWYDNPNTTQ